MSFLKRMDEDFGGGSVGCPARGGTGRRAEQP